MLRAFLDGSGSHGSSNHYVVAGHMATVDEWDQFSSEWSKILESHGLTEFHTKEFYSRFKDPESKYRHIERAEGEVLLDELAEAIRSRVMLAIGGILPMGAYNQQVRGRHEAIIGQPYTVATNIMLMAVKRWANEIDYKSKYRDPIVFFFELGDPHAAEMFNAFQEAMNLPEFKDEGWLGAISFQPKGTPTARGLESADILAHTLYAEKRGQLAGADVFENMARFGDAVPRRILEIDDDGLQQWIAKRQMIA
jgi:hypothetical protein